jgi:hypothetical protein
MAVEAAASSRHSQHFSVKVKCRLGVPNTQHGLLEGEALGLWRRRGYALQARQQAQAGDLRRPGKRESAACRPALDRRDRTHRQGVQLSLACHRDRRALVGSCIPFRHVAGFLSAASRSLLTLCIAWESHLEDFCSAEPGDRTCRLGQQGGNQLRRKRKQKTFEGRCNVRSSHSRAKKNDALGDARQAGRPPFCHPKSCLVLPTPDGQAHCPTDQKGRKCCSVPRVM